MGVVKKASRRKTESLHIRLTPADMAVIRERCASSGYLSLTKFVTRSLVNERKSAGRAPASSGGGAASDRLDSHLNVLTQQVRGIAANYNQSVAIMNTLCRSIDDRRVKYMVVKQAARLESLTKEMIDLLHEIRDEIQRLSGVTGSEAAVNDD